MFRASGWSLGRPVSNLVSLFALPLFANDFE